jgi:hypothetical protein
MTVLGAGAMEAFVVNVQEPNGRDEEERELLIPSHLGYILIYPEADSVSDSQILVEDVLEIRNSKCFRLLKLE